MTPQEIVTLLKDLVTMGAASVAAIIAIKGYDTWKKQLRGKTEYELARSLLRSVYRVRDAIRSVRNPLVTSGETAEALQQAGVVVDPSDVKSQPQISQAVYQERWKVLQAALTELEADSLEAEVLWGKGLTDSLKPLHDQVRVLFVGIQRYLYSLGELYSTRKERHTERYAEAYETVMDFGEDDSLNKKVEDAVKQAEEALRPYLSLAPASKGKSGRSK